MTLEEYLEFVLIKYGKTDVDMMVLKEEDFYTHRSLETGVVLYHTVFHEEALGSVKRKRK